MVADRPKFRSSLNQEDLDRLLDGKCPQHNNANHTARECCALSNSVAPEKPKNARLDKRNKLGSSRGSRRRGRKNRSPRRDREEHSDGSLDDFQKEQRAANFIYGGSSIPSCRHQLKLHNHEVNSVFRHSVELLRWSEMSITFDR